MYWIGGNDLATKGRWVWASNGYRIYPYVNWKAAESPEADGMAMETGIILLMAAVIFVKLRKGLDTVESLSASAGLTKSRAFATNVVKIFLVP